MFPIVGILGILIASLVTLEKNISEGAILTIAATLPYFSSIYFSDQHAIILVWAMLGFTVLNNVFTWIFSVMLRQQMNLSVVIQIAALIGVLAVSIVHLAYPNVTEWWSHQLHNYYANVQSANSGLFAAATPQSIEDLNSLIDHFKQYATGYVVMLILVSALSMVILGRWWQAKVFHPGSLKGELHFLRLNQLTGFLFIISLVLSYWGNGVVIDMMPIINVLFFTVGLSLVHYFFALMKSKYRLVWLIFFYGILLIGMPVSGVLIVVAAFVDIWFDFRTRFKTV